MNTPNTRSWCLNTFVTKTRNLWRNGRRQVWEKEIKIDPRIFCCLRIQRNNECIEKTNEQSCWFEEVSNNHSGKI